MSVKGVVPIVSEYNLLWEALKHYEKHLEKLFSMTTDEGQQLKYDEKLQDIVGLLSSVRNAAQSDYNLDLR